MGLLDRAKQLWERLRHPTAPPRKRAEFPTAVGLLPQEFPHRAERSNRGRPLAGMRFVVEDSCVRQRTGDFRMVPEDLALEMLRAHEEGMSARALAAEYHFSESGVKRRLRNARDFREASATRRQGRGSAWDGAQGLEMDSANGASEKAGGAET